MTSTQDKVVLALPKASVLGPPACARDPRVSLANGKAEPPVFFLLQPLGAVLRGRGGDGGAETLREQTVLLAASSQNDSLSCWAGSSGLSRSLPMT